MNKKPTVIISISIAVIVIAVILRVTLAPKANTAGPAGMGARSSGPIAVQTAEVQFRSISDRRELTGTIKASYTYVITAKVNGRLEKLRKRIGDPVRRDESVGLIDKTEHEQAVLEAKAQEQISMASVAEAQAQLTQLARELRRTTSLLEKGISSQAELDALQTQVDAQRSRLDLARAQLAQRKASLSLSQTRLGYTDLRAAQKGLVAERHTDGGAQLAVGAPVLTIIGIDTVYVEIALTERDYARIAVGNEALVRVEAVANKAFTGKITRTAPQFQTATRTAIAEVAIVNDSLQLKPGMFARVSLTFAKKYSAQVVPSSALVTRDGSPALFTLDGTTAKMVQVVPGIIDSDFTEILEPALSGPIVTLGNHLLKDGSTVMTGPPGQTRQGGPERSGAGPKGPDKKAAPTENSSGKKP